MPIAITVAEHLSENRMPVQGCAKRANILLCVVGIAACANTGAGAGDHVSSRDDCGEGFVACPAFIGCTPAPGYVCQSAPCEGPGSSKLCIPRSILDLEVDVEGPEHAIGPNDDAAITVTVANHGPSAAHAWLSLLLPESLGASGSAFACGSRSREGNLSCGVDLALDAGASTRIKLTVRVNATGHDLPTTFYAMVHCVPPLGAICEDTKRNNDFVMYTLMVAG